jgi:hypothetical protein
VSPADIAVVWPTADEILCAVRAAAAREGEDPIDVLQGMHGSRARLYAGLALAHEYPTAPRLTLGSRIGQAGCLASYRAGLKSGSLKWFDLGRLNDVRGACNWTAMTAAAAIDAALTYCGRDWTELLPGAAAAPPPTTPVEPKLDAPAVVTRPLSKIAQRVATALVPAPAREPVEVVFTHPPKEIQRAYDAVMRDVEPSPPKALVKPPKALSNPPKAPSSAPIAAPTPRLTPSPAAAALASAAIAMRAAKTVRGSALAPRIIDHRVTGLCEIAGTPPPGRSALDQRNASVARP